MINIDTEEKQDSGESEYKFPIFFTVSGYMDSQLNPEIDDKYNSIIKPIDREIARRKMQNGMITRAIRNINISLTHYEDMGHSQKDLDTLIKLRDSLKKPTSIVKLVGRSSPKEVWEHIIQDNTKDLATNMSNFIETHQEYRVTPICKGGFMLQKK